MKIAVLVIGELNNYKSFSSNLNDKLAKYDYDMFVYTSKTNADDSKNKKKSILKAFGKDKVKKIEFSENDKAYNNMFEKLRVDYKNKIESSLGKELYNKEVVNIHMVINAWLMFSFNHKNIKGKDYDVVVRLDPNVLYYDEFNFEDYIDVIKDDTMLIKYFPEIKDCYDTCIVMNSKIADKLSTLVYELFKFDNNDNKDRILTSPKALGKFIFKHNLKTQLGTFTEIYLYDPVRFNVASEYLKRNVKSPKGLHVMSSIDTYLKTSKDKKVDDDSSSSDDDSDNNTKTTPKLNLSSVDSDIDSSIRKIFKDKNIIVKIVTNDTWVKALEEIQNEKPDKKGIKKLLSKRGKVVIVFKTEADQVLPLKLVEVSKKRKYKLISYNKDKIIKKIT